MKIQSRLLFSYLGIAAIVAVTGAIGYFVTGQITAAYGNVNEQFEEKVRPAVEIQAHIRRSVSSLQLYFLVGDVNDKAVFYDRVSLVQERITILEGTLGIERLGQLEKIKSAVNEIEIIGQQLILSYEDSPQGFFSIGYQTQLRALDESAATARITAEEITNAEIDAIKADSQRTAETVSSIQASFIILIIAALGSALFIGFISSRGITKPLEELNKSASEIAHGNFDAKTTIRSHDELGILAAGFERMKNELKEKDKVKDEFIKIASHELGSPVVPILLNAEALQEEVGEGNERVRTIVRNARKINNLTNIFLDVSRLESRTFKLIKEKTNIVDLIKEVVKDSEIKIPHDKDLKIILNCSIGIEEQIVDIDRSRIGQVLTNLIDNSIKFTDNGVISITVDITAGDNGTNNILVRMSDTGNGIHPSIKDRLFEKYATMSENKKGTGLGLYLCRAVIESHGGKIWAENNAYGPGATLSFLLPVRQTYN